MSIQRKAFGRVILDWNVVMHILARGHQKYEQIHTLPELPKDVFVRSVHNNPGYMGFEFILESVEPVEGWTDYWEEGSQIPLSPAGQDLRGRISKRIEE